VDQVDVDDHHEHDCVHDWCDEYFVEKDFHENEGIQSEGMTPHVKMND
jgi:coproporphyrinogen III oxidase